MYTGSSLSNLRHTRKLSYHKDDRAMRPIYGCLKIFGSPWLRPWLYFSRNFNGLLFRLSLWMCTQNLKFVALHVRSWD